MSMSGSVKKDIFGVSLKDTLVSLAVLLTAALICSGLRVIYGSDISASIVFVLAVFLISRYTKSYIYGIIASVMGVLIVNFLFTYPYYRFNFTLLGYPITIICSLVVSVITSTMTQRLKQQEKLRADAQRERTRANLLRAVSHDLRTPLTSILGANSAVLENDSALSPEERRVLLKSVNEDAQWLIRMVENLLTITRMDTGGARIQKQPEAVEEVMAEAVVKFTKRFPERRVEACAPGELLMAPMDAMLIEQVIINLLENSALHAKGATYIKLEACERDGCAVVTVTDDGCGIAPGVIGRIFESYLQEDGDKSPDAARNMGIGLSVCRTIINAHGGVIKAENRKEGGAVMSFTLPLGEGI